MRSYYAHLSTTAPEKIGPIAPKPTCRASAIFPAFRSGISSRIIFLGYWQLKRNIEQLTAVRVFAFVHRRASGSHSYPHY